MEGIDCSTRLTLTSAQALKNSGISAVGRYLGYKQGWWKSLTPEEVKAIQTVGLSLFLIWESSPTQVGYFSYVKGLSDARLAVTEAEFLAAPHGVAIYFTVDYDAQPGDMAAITEYFRGINDGLGGKYLLGVYGSYYVIKNIKVDKYYQTYAWSKGQKAASHIYQYQNDVMLQGISVDKDYVNTDAGLWEATDMLAEAVLLNTKEDFWAGEDIVVKSCNFAVFLRGADKSIPKDAMSAKKLIVIGGSTTGHPNEVLLSGKTKYDTAAAVGKYLSTNGG